jgi:hypothetical protein
VHVRSDTTLADPYAVLPKDLVGRRSDTGVLDRVWTSDIAYPRTGQCRQHLCAVRDGCCGAAFGAFRSGRVQPGGDRGDRAASRRCV